MLGLNWMIEIQSLATSAFWLRRRQVQAIPSSDGLLSGSWQICIAKWRLIPGVVVLLFHKSM